LVLSLDALADITPGDEKGYFPLHTVPPKLFLQVLIHFGASGMDRIRGVVGFLQNKLLQLLNVRDA
jgi:hypothetical protein